MKKVALDSNFFKTLRQKAKSPGSHSPEVGKLFSSDPNRYKSLKDLQTSNIDIFNIESQSQILPEKPNAVAYITTEDRNQNGILDTINIVSPVLEGKILESFGKPLSQYQTLDAENFLRLLDYFAHVLLHEREHLHGRPLEPGTEPKPESAVESAVKYTPPPPPKVGHSLLNKYKKEKDHAMSIEKKSLNILNNLSKNLSKVNKSLSSNVSFIMKKYAQDGYTPQVQAATNALRNAMTSAGFEPAQISGVIDSLDELVATNQNVNTVPLPQGLGTDQNIQRLARAYLIAVEGEMGPKQLQQPQQQGQQSEDQVARQQPPTSAEVAWKNLIAALGRNKNIKDIGGTADAIDALYEGSGGNPNVQIPQSISSLGKDVVQAAKVYISEIHKYRKAQMGTVSKKPAQAPQTRGGRRQQRRQVGKPAAQQQRRPTAPAAAAPAAAAAAAAAAGAAAGQGAARPQQAQAAYSDESLNKIADLKDIFSKVISANQSLPFGREGDGRSKK